MPIIAQDSQNFLGATQIAQTQPEEAYRIFKEMEPRNAFDANLLAWLIFSAPTYEEKRHWVKRVRTILPGDPIAQQALGWFDSLPVPAESVLAAEKEAQARLAEGAVVFEERNRDFIQGQSAKIYSTQRWTDLLLIIIAGIGAFVIFGFGLVNFFIEKQIYDSGVSVSGRVVGRSISSGRRSTTYYLDYTFSARNPATGQVETFRRHEDVQESVYRTYSSGSSVPVRFLPQHPQDARVVSGGIDIVKWLLWLGLTGFVTSICLFCVIAYWREGKNWQELEKDSQRIVGGLTNVQKRTKGFYTSYELTYGFVSPQSGKYITRKVTLGDKQGTRIVDGETFEVNRPVFILYKSDKKYVAL